MDLKSVFKIWVLKGEPKEYKEKMRQRLYCIQESFLAFETIQRVK